MSVKEISTKELHEILGKVGAGSATCTYDLETCSKMAPMINEINRLKKEQNAVILAHSYVAPEIIYGVADYRSDSYMLSKNAMEAEADTIIFSAVRFMGETAKILNPSKEVLIPGVEDGCSLADSVTAKDVIKLRAEYPDHVFMCYINTTAEVKAECDVCVTSSNVYNIVENYPSDKIVFLPDELMGQNVQDEMKRRGVDKDIVLYKGVCYVHELYDPETIAFLRGEYADLQVVSHPECSPGIAAHSDYVGSTGQMMDYIKENEAENYLLLTECGLSNRLQIELPEKKFIGSCNMCKYMKSNTLESILRVLKEPTERDRIILSDEMISKSKTCIEEMFKYAEAK